MKKISSLLLLLLSQFGFSQNLVPNGSFEVYDTCPSAVAQMNKAVGWSDYRGTPDYFNSCNHGEVGVPENIYHYIYAKTGNAYAGFAAFNKTGNYGQECLGIQLEQSLIIGEKYFVSLYFNRVVDNAQAINIASNKLGVRFSTVAYSYQHPVPIDNFSQIYTDSVISDTLDWVRISGSFTADSAYDYLSIGNFFLNSEINYISYDSLAGLSYYFVDDIKVSSDSNYVNGISEYKNPDILEISPNPARDWIAIGGNGIRSLLLFDAVGRIVYTSDSVIISPIQIDISSFTKGIYFLKAIVKGNSIVQKLVIQ